MSTKVRLSIMIAIFAILGGAAICYHFIGDLVVLYPTGLIADKERDLLIIATELMLIVCVPVCFLTFIIAWKYRRENEKAKYEPDWGHSLMAECIWWGVPLMIIVVLGIFAWKGSHALDPFRPIEAKKELKVQVVSMRWKWLFIYPEQKIATVNYLKIPEKTSIHFELTSDAPMNSFWIPSLGGQIYTMPGMRSELYLLANETGTWRGLSANISGKGFASMYFPVESTTSEDFESWIASVQSSPQQLGSQEYNKLLSPSEYNPAAFYVLSDEGLFDQIIMKYMIPTP